MTGNILLLWLLSDEFAVFDFQMPAFYGDFDPACQAPFGYIVLSCGEISLHFYESVNGANTWERHCPKQSLGMHIRALVQLNRARSAAVDAPIMPSLKSNKLCKSMNANNNEDKETQRKVSNWTNN